MVNRDRKVDQCAKKVGIAFKMAWRWDKARTLDASQTSTGMVIGRDWVAEKQRVGLSPVCGASVSVLGGQKQNGMQTGSERAHRCR